MAIIGPGHNIYVDDIVLLFQIQLGGKIPESLYRNACIEVDLDKMINVSVGHGCDLQLPVEVTEPDSTIRSVLQMKPITA